MQIRRPEMVGMALGQIEREVSKMTQTELTRQDKLQLGHLTTRDEAGRHFYEVFDGAWLERMEAAGYITINRPTHEATGIAYSQEYHTVQVSDEVADWFDAYGDLDDEANYRCAFVGQCRLTGPEQQHLDDADLLAAAVHEAEEQGLIGTEPHQITADQIRIGTWGGSR